MIPCWQEETTFIIISSWPAGWNEDDLSLCPWNQVTPDVACFCRGQGDIIFIRIHCGLDGLIERFGCLEVEFDGICALLQS